MDEGRERRMSYFFDNAEREAEDLINEVVRELDHEDSVTFTSGLSNDFRKRLIQKLAQRLYDLNMDLYDAEQSRYVD